MTNPAQDAIKAEIQANDVVLFMKGTAAMPQCGFSSRVAGVLNYMGVQFKDVNVLSDHLEAAEGAAAESARALEEATRRIRVLIGDIEDGEAA